MPNRQQRRKGGDTKPKQADFNKAATTAAQTLLDTSAILVQSIKKGEAPTHLEVMGLATIILKDVYEELMKEMTQAADETKAEVLANAGDTPAETEKENA